MDEQKQIEEMAKDYYGYSIDLEDDCKFVAEEMYDKGHRKIPENAVVLTREEHEKLRILADECLDWRRKNCNVGELPKENAVVLTQEEWTEHYELFAKAMYQKEVNTRKETAEKFAERLKDVYASYQKYTAIYVTTIREHIDEIAKEITDNEV